MRPEKQIEFRGLVISYMQALDRMDARELIAECEKMEGWIEQYVNEEVTRAVAPFIKIKVNGK